MRRFFILMFLALAANLRAAEAGFSPETIVPPNPPREFRAAWIATVANIDWPSKPGLPVAQQQAELLSLLDRAAQLHFNAVFFQVRSVSDAFYASSIEPWSEYLTGVQGRPPSPYYDPLAFAVTEAHRRGLELHAWFNPFRAAHPLAKSPPAANHITRTVPELVRHYGDQTWLDPGEPPVQARVLAVILDVVKRYDIDGVVLDDYFYPYPLKNASGQPLDFPDDPSWKRYGVAGGLSRADWRRDNINRFILRLSQSLKTAKPGIQFGISSFGIWRPKNPPVIAGLDAYEKIYADSRKWLAEGWVDFLAPQLYWSTSATEQSFPVLLDWWRAQNARRRHVWPALADWKFAPDEIARQLQFTRQKGEPGSAHYHLRSILDNPAQTAGMRALYATPVLVPLSPWLPVTQLPSATLSVSRAGKAAHVSWPNAIGKTPGWWLLQARVSGMWSTQILPGTRMDSYLDNPNADTVVLRGVDRLGNIGLPAVWTLPKYSAPPSRRGLTR
jgi:uncharacterized lipoprotein YddW (UPF0748 family)